MQVRWAHARGQKGHEHDVESKVSKNREKMCIGNLMNAMAIKDLHYEWYLKILAKLHEP